MAGLGMDFSVNLEDLLKLKDLIQETKNEIKQFYALGDSSSAKAQEKNLKNLQAEHARLEKSLSPVIHQYQQLEKAGKETFSNIAKSSKLTEISEQLTIQKSVIKDLETQYESYKKSFDKLNVGGHRNTAQVKEYENAKKMFIEVRAEMNAEKKALSELEKMWQTESNAVNKSNTSRQTYATQLRKIRDEMTGLISEGKQETQRYQELQTELEKVGTSYRVAQKEQQNLVTSGSQLSGLASGITAISGAFAAGQGVAALFAKNNEQLAAIQTKLQAAMAITIGLQQVSAALHQTSAFRINTVRKATELWKGAQAVLNTQLGIGVGLSKALMVSGIGLLIAGIAALVQMYDSWKKKQAEINKLQEEFRNIEIEVAKSMADQSVKVKALISVAENYNSSLKIRNEALRQLKEIMPGYNGYIDKEGRLVANTDAALKNYLATLYKVEKAKKLFADISKKQGEIEEVSQKGITADDISFLDKLKVAGLNIFNKERGTREWDAAVKKRYDEVIDNLREQEGALEEDLKKLLEDDSVFKSLFGDQKYENKLIKDAEKSAKEQLKLQESINEEMRKLVEKNTSDRIALMDKGTQREIAQIQDRYNKTMSEIQRQEAEWRKDQGGSLTAEQEVIIKSTKHTAASTAVKDEEEVLKQLRDKYQDYADQREAIEEKFNKDIKALEDQRAIAAEQGIAEMVESLDRAIAKATKDKGKELITFDFNVFKESPEYVRAFEDLKNTSTETLTYLSEKLEEYKGKASESLDPAELQAYTAAIQAIINELTERDPFGKLANAQNRLIQSSKKLADARKKLKAAEDSGDTEKVTEAQRELNEATDEYTKASNDVQKAQKKVKDVIGQLYDAIAGVGDAIGGTAGEILNFIADIGKFVSVTAEGMTTTAKGLSTTVQMIERASAILFIIQMAIQLISKLQGFLKDSHQQYLDYSKEIAQINALRDAVTEYEIAVTKAKQAQESWFAEDRLRDMKNNWELNGKYLDAYNKKVDEQQAKYQNEKGGGLFSSKNANSWLTRISNVLSGNPTALIGNALLYDKDKYDKEQVRAIDNLRIETQKKTSGFLGIGGKSQKTMDLREWARENNFGELFDENGVIDTKVAEAILKANEEGTIKLVGETEETLRILTENRKLYEEYQQQLQEYVSSLYSPLVDNMVDAIWDWFDSGKDALDSFKEYASDTFREIANDMLRNLANKYIFAGYEDEIKDLYEEYFASDMTESDAEKLYKGIADATGRLEKRAEENLPILQESLVGLDKTLQNIGINMKDDSEIQENTLKGAYTKASQESINLLAGHTGAVRVLLEGMYSLLNRTLGDTFDISVWSQVFDGIQFLKEIQSIGWRDISIMRETTERIEILTGNIRELNTRIADSNDELVSNSIKTAAGIQSIESRGILMRGTGLGL